MSKQAEFAVILKMNAMFADLGADELQRLANLCHTQHLGNGEVLFQKGDAAIVSGVRQGPYSGPAPQNGSRLTLNFMGPGDLFGEVAVLDGQSRTGDATAGEASELLCCGAKTFSLSSEREPKVGSRSSRCCASASAGRASAWKVRAPAAAGWPARGASARSPAIFGSDVKGETQRLRAPPPRDSQPPACGQPRKEAILDLQRGRILLRNMTKLTAIARNE